MKHTTGEFGNHFFISFLQCIVGALSLHKALQTRRLLWAPAHCRHICHAMFLLESAVLWIGSNYPQICLGWVWLSLNRCWVRSLFAEN